MNTKQVQYALVLAQNLNFSQTAEQLGITQPALSKQILALEKDLGVRLFDRSTLPLSVTPAGEHFFAQAKELLMREEQLRQDMADFQSGNRGRLTIGISPFRCLYLMPELLQKLQTQYPGLQIVLREGKSHELHKLAADGLVDFAIMNLPVDETLLEVLPLAPERILLAVPESMADSVPVEAGQTEGGYPVADLQNCQALPFVVLGSQQVHRVLFDKLCQKAGIVPNIAVETVGITSAWAMTRAGIGATLLPAQFIETAHFRENIRFFALSGSGTPRHPAIIRKKGAALSPFAQTAIDLIQTIDS